MSYSGMQPTYGTFPSDLFTANGSNTVFTLSSVPGNKAALLVSIDGVRQQTDAYSYSANTLTFSEAPANGSVIEAVNMGSRADVIVTDGVYRKTQFTATAAQTNFNIATGYTVGFVDVYLNGIRLVGADDFTANDGSTIILAVAAAAGDSVEVVAYGTFNVANALQKSGDTMSGNLVVSGTSIMATPHVIANTSANTVVFANTGVVTFNANTTHVGAATFSNTVSAPVVVTPVGSGLSAAYTAQNATAIYPTVNTGAGYPFLENSNLVLQRNSDRDFIVGGLNGSTLQQELVVKRGGYVTTPYQPCLLMKSTIGATPTIAHATYTKMTWLNTTAYSRGLTWDGVNNRVTVPVTGVYLVAYSAAFTSGTNYPGSDWLMPLWVNGAASPVMSGDGYYSTGFNSGAVPTYPFMQKTFMVPLNANDYVEVFMYQDSGGTRTIYGDFSFFQIALLG